MKFRLRAGKKGKASGAEADRERNSEEAEQETSDGQGDGGGSIDELREQARRSISSRRGGEAGGEEDGENDESRRAAALLLRRRALLRAARRVLRAKKLTLLLAGMAIVLTIIFTVAVVQERMGNFTININRMELYRQGLMLSDDEAFSKPKSRLRAAAVDNATNISIDDLPDNLDEIDGSHNGKDYMAYTFYVKNGGKETIDYYSNILIEMEAKGVSAAIRVALYDETGKRVIYAKPARNGKPEPGTKPFVDDDIVMEHYVRNFEVGDVDKYTVVTWLEGDDPECVDSIIGGMIRLSMNIEVDKPIKDK